MAHMTMGCIGDSISATDNQDYYPTTASIFTDGRVRHAVPLLSGDATLAKYATSGYTTQQMIDDHLADAVSSPWDIIVIHAGINDCNSGVAAATCISNIEAMAISLHNAGKIVVLTSLMPSGELTTTPETDAWAAVNTGIDTLVSTYSWLYFADFGDAVIDPSTASDPMPSFISGLSSDGTHPNTSGHIRVGQKLADTLLTIPGMPAFARPETNTDGSITNPLMVGDGGSVLGGGTGNTADDWFASNSISGDVGSKLARSDGLTGAWQVFDSPVVSTALFRPNSNVILPSSPAWVCMEFEILSGETWHGSLGPELLIFGVGGGNAQNYAWGRTSELIGKKGTMCRYWPGSTATGDAEVSLLIRGGQFTETRIGGVWVDLQPSASGGLLRRRSRKRGRSRKY